MNSKTTHSPAPWHAISVFVDNAPNQWQVHTRGTTKRFNGDCVAIVDSETDARLIAAAPDLLAALQDMCSCEYGTDAAYTAVRKARAAIVKATQECSQ